MIVLFIFRMNFRVVRVALAHTDSEGFEEPSSPSIPLERVQVVPVLLRYWIVVYIVSSSLYRPDCRRQRPRKRKLDNVCACPGNG